jgi:diguanylate cyclase (GGDEF)-like protein
MPEVFGLHSVDISTAAISQPLRLSMQQSLRPNPLEDTAGFGSWWFDPETSQIVLSAAAARYFNVGERHYHRLDDCFIHVIADDMLRLMRKIKSKPAPPLHCEFRVISATEGLRWLRLSTLPDEKSYPQILSGIVVDITAIKLAAMRERLGFELTEFLVGSHTLSDAVTNAIQLICKNLGWEWGAYWALESSPQGAPQLACKHHWHHPEHDMTAFSSASATLCMAPGEGLVGRVWQSGKPSWVEDMTKDAHFLRRTSARACQLWSGYVFPVTYLSEDGQQHTPGVLEFYSSLSRQPEAQLPNLSATIGALIAQTAQRLEHQAQILYLAQVDELTGLANRSHFHAQLTKACTQATKTHTSFGLMFIDLDRFKAINDAFGHDAGNVVLCEFARRLQALTPHGASAGRLGGDEFALLLPESSVEALASLAQDILQTARTPFIYEGIELAISASIGISTWPENGETVPELLRSADSAMYRIKQQGKNGCDFFSSTSPCILAQQQSSLAQRLAIETELHHALHGNELFLLYQPIVDITTGKLHAVEALIRWKRVDGQIIPPNVFIPIAEQSHLIVKIGKWVVAQACRDLAKLRQNHFKDLKIHVNMAASEFTSSTLPEELFKLVTALGLEPQSVSLELTEGMLMKHPEQVIPVMHTLRQLGFEISLDDFGMGHSSLSLLKNLPISSLKIDRSFVSGLGQQVHDSAIVKTIVDLGTHLNLKTIAEGIETESQLEILKQSGCTLVQGFLLSKPLSLADLLMRRATEPWDVISNF